MITTVLVVLMISLFAPNSCVSVVRVVKCGPVWSICISSQPGFLSQHSRALNTQHNDVLIMSMLSRVELMLFYFTTNVISGNRW